MKKYSISIVFAVIMFGAIAQQGSTLIRHDTVLLKSVECNWLIPLVHEKDHSLNNTSEGTVGGWLLQTVKKGKLKAFDSFTGKQIPANQIYTWNLPVDTAADYNVNTGTTKYRIVRAKLDPARITQIRVQQDWRLNYTSGEIFSQIRWIELLTEAFSSLGEVIGTKPFCRIYYR
jgi:hypothetical protein